MKKLNATGPIIEPWVKPFGITDQSLKEFINLIRCFRLCK